jgi:cytochrome P450
MAKEAKSFTFRVNLPIIGTPMVVAVGDVETHRAVLTHRATERPIELMYKTFDNVTCGVPSIFTSNGEYWHKRRKLIAPAFEKSHVMRMNAVALAKTEEWIETQLRPMVQKGEAFDVGNEMVGMILSALCETAFEFQLSKEDEKQYRDDLEICLREFLFKSTTNPFRALLGSLIPERRRAYQAAERLMGLAKKVMENYRTLPAPLKDTIIDRVMNSGVYASEREIQSDIVFLLLAGHETTGYSIAWTLLELARNQEHLKAVRQAVASLRSEEYHSCSTLQNVIKEAMRLHPVAAAGSFRVLGENMETKEGYFLPVGTIVFLPLILLLRNPSVFENPDQFQPSRWENATPKMTSSFLPFSLGKQNCVGQALAKIELDTVIARIISEFDLSVADEGVTEYFLTMKPIGAKLLATKANV